MRVEVRCCCDPGRLLGWIEIPGQQHIAEGDRFSFLLQPAKDQTPYAEACFRASALYGIGRDALTLDVAFWYDRQELPDGNGGVVIANAREGLALRSNDTPIEKLRRIIGFEEASES